MYTVYVLKDLESGKVYKGMTANLDRRIKEHNSGQTRSTKNGKWEIIHIEEFSNSEKARKREKYFKSAAGRRYLNKILAP